MPERREIVILGAGFAGALLARTLQASGRDVLLLERDRHPRFALGESTTPLANIALERLARRFGFTDLDSLAAWGRWLRDLPHLRRGLKRGFSFYWHAAGREYRNGLDNDARLAVAASPEDAVADSHWLRADVDHHLVERAVLAGVDYRDRVAVDAVECTPDRVFVRATHREGEGVAQPVGLEIAAELVIDASGAGQVLARYLRIPRREAQIPFSSRLVASHFEGLPPFAEVAPEAGRPPGPFPEEWAAVHHLTDSGWMYQLRFDHGITSAGFLVRSDRAGPDGFDLDQPERAWSRLLARYPSLERQFRDARPVLPLRSSPRLQTRLAQAAGRRWAVLPHSFAFYDPLFSIGIAWSLLGVERITDLLAGGDRDPEGLAEYARLLDDEADHLERLFAGAWATIDDFPLFAEFAHAYFAAASYAEIAQRILEPPRELPGWAWAGFLGARDPESSSMVAELAAEAIAAAARRRVASSAERERIRGSYAEQVRTRIAPRNLAGLADPRRVNLYAVDLEVLCERSELLGLSRREMEAALPKLRGGLSPPQVPSDPTSM